jgi:hypothetical protein
MRDYRFLPVADTQTKGVPTLYVFLGAGGAPNSAMAIRVVRAKGPDLVEVEGVLLQAVPLESFQSTVWRFEKAADYVGLDRIDFVKRLDRLLGFSDLLT